MRASDKAALDIAAAIPLLTGLVGGMVAGLLVNWLLGLALVLVGVVWSIKADRALDELDDSYRRQ